MKAKVNKNKAKNIKMNKVKDFREEKTWSITDLSKEAGITYQTISKMEKGIPTRRNSQLKIAKALGESHEDVFPNN